MEVMNEALAAESEILDASGADIVSTIFTLTRTVIHATLDLGADPAELRRGVEQLLLDCAGPKGH